MNYPCYAVTIGADKKKVQTLDEAFDILGTNPGAIYKYNSADQYNLVHRQQYSLEAGGLAIKGN